MTEIIVIVLAVALINHLLRVQFLGPSPLIQTAQRFESTFGMALATGVVLTTASGAAYLVDRFVLVPFNLPYLRLIAFVLAVGIAVQLAATLVRRSSAVLHRPLDLYAVLVASNCTVLGVALSNSAARDSLIAALGFGAGAALGFGLALALFAGLHERSLHADPPRPFRGHALTFVTAGILSLAFLGFSGFARL